MLGFDALWIDQRGIEGRLAADEIQNVAAFIATGRRVVMIGEHQSWFIWNSDILSTVGGAPLYGTSGSGIATPVSSHPLTAGVSQVSMPVTGIAVGGTPLFNVNFATLWGDSVLTILDENIFNSVYWSTLDNAQFAGNVATWVTTAPTAAVPEPGTLVFVAAGLVFLVRREPLL
jgi:hypothetical protein